MKHSQNNNSQHSGFLGLKDTLYRKNPLYILSHAIDWGIFEKEFAGLYAENKCSATKPIRRMVGLLMLKHVRNVSDESLVAEWSENIYYQYFCGESSFVCEAPCEISELAYFRNCIGEKGVELILKACDRASGSDR